MLQILVVLFVGYVTKLFKLLWLYCTIQLLQGSSLSIQKKSADTQEKDLQISIKGLEQGLKWPRSIFFIDVSALEDETTVLFQNVGHQSPCDRTQILEDGRPQMHCCKSLKTWEASCCFCKMLGDWVVENHCFVVCCNSVAVRIVVSFRPESCSNVSGTETCMIIFVTAEVHNAHNDCL
jgi:hypothetical protein